jgi:peptidoglycan/LPS O-acetylase OafA/YrhL
LIIQILEAREAQKFYFQAVANGTYAVDTFFFMSGFLVVTLFLKNYKKFAKAHGEESKMQTPVQWFTKTGLLIFYRYGRLTPIYLLVLLYSVVGTKFAYNQTVFPNNPDLIDHVTCEKYWWRNVLYINNWFPKDEICMIWSWFLANEMQFYAMAILLLIISLR